MAIAIVVIIALLGINGFLWYTKVQQDKIIASNNTDLITAEQTQAELEKEYYETLSELEEMRTASDELNAIIDGQKEELKTQKARVNQLITVEKDYEAARAEISKLREMRDKFVAQVNKLQEENEALAATNQQLQAEKVSLTEEVQTKTLENEELKNETEVMAFRNETLLKERENLADKVTFASVVQVDDIIVNGYRLKNNGKESLTKRAEKAEGLKVCFEAGENTITDAGEERFYVRIVDPLGATMAMDDMGSGVIQDANEKQVRFTQYRDIPYENMTTDACLSWQPGVSFKEGLYLVEVYNKGHLAGSSTFTLK